jgi:hypothetical protein
MIIIHSQSGSVSRGHNSLMAVTHVLFVSFMIVNCILDYQTDDMTDSQQSLSWEADSSSASQEVPLLLSHHAPLLFSQHASGAVRPVSGIPILTLSFCFFNIHSIVILPSTSAVSFLQVLP